MADDAPEQPPPEAAIRLPAEERTARELEALAADDEGARPPGWELSPRAVEAYVCGTDEPVSGPDGEAIPIRPKFYGERALVQVAIATLASDRALLLVGEPGTGKSWLSEHLAAAISGTSERVVQGTAGTTEEAITHSWNYALLIAEGPSERALVPSPILRAMEEGRVARFEEVTRAPSEVQDALIGILSEKRIPIPELSRNVRARRGFNLIATANTRDRGVFEMSSALKRRFNFVRVPVIADLEEEVRIVRRRTEELRAELGAGTPPPDELVRAAVRVFQELRAGRTKDGRAKLRSLSTVPSTAEAISCLLHGVLLADAFGDGPLGPAELGRSIAGTATTAREDDREALAEYVETALEGRDDPPWPALRDALRDALDP